MSADEDALYALQKLKVRRDATTSSAPGRVNLIGEHTDYSGGLVMPLALDRRTHVALCLNNGKPGQLRANSREAGLAVGSINQPVSNHWTDYIRGAVLEMRKVGAEISSIDLGVASDVPLGAGVSSSAALEISVLRAIRLETGINLSDVDLAYMAQRIENDHLRLKTGIMDQMASSLGDVGRPLLFDTYTGNTEPLPSFQDCVFLTFHSGISRRLLEGAYNERRASTDLALKLLNLKQLVAVSTQQIESLPEAIQPRIRHVVSENTRVLKAASAIREQESVRFGKLMNEAHESMRDDFEASHKEVDLQVNEALKMGAIGARITGAGFGGCYVILVPTHKSEEIRTKLLRKFQDSRQVA